MEITKIVGFDIDSLFGLEFEKVCQQLVENMGVKTETTKVSRDSVGMQNLLSQYEISGVSLTNVNIKLSVISSEDYEVGMFWTFLLGTSLLGAINICNS